MLLLALLLLLFFLAVALFLPRRVGPALLVADGFMREEATHAGAGNL